MLIILRDCPFDPWKELSDLVGSHNDLKGKFGANAVFVGTMRDYNEGENIVCMELEHYPGMTEAELERLCTECTQGYEVLELFVIHRVGRIYPGESIVLVSVWTAHRASAFEVCREVMEALKHRAPLWKKEQLENRTRWVEQNTPG